MTADEVKQRVLREIGDRSTNRFKWDFRQFVLPEPELRSYDGEQLWTVLVERNSNGGEGYHIVFDADEEMFGLASGGVCVGLYGGFLDALDAM